MNGGRSTEKFKYLQSLDQMERISREELGRRLDEILDIVTRDNVAYVIADEGKSDLVLCPAYWFECAYDDDFGCMINSAVRYAIGRRSYMPSVAMAFIRKHINVFDTRTIRVMIEDIERESEDEGLDYRADWLKLRDDLKSHYEGILQTDTNKRP